MEDKPTSSKILSYYKIIKRKPQFKPFKFFFLFNFVALFGILMLPGSKIPTQYTLKLLLNDLYTDILMTMTSVYNSPNYIEYVGTNIIHSLLSLARNGVSNSAFIIKNLQRLNRLIQENQDNEDLKRGSLLNMGTLLKHIAKEEQDTFLEDEFLEGLMDFLNLIVEKSKFTDTFQFLKDRSNLLNEGKYVLLIDSYKEIVSIINVLLGYQKDVSEKCKIYQKFVSLIRKENSDIFKFEEEFTNVNGMNYLLRDLKENNQELNLNCLQFLTFLFRNESAAIKLLKIRILSNLIKHIFIRNEDLYEKYILEIIENAEKHEAKDILLSYSKDFEAEKDNLKKILISKDFNKTIKTKLEHFLNIVKN